MNFSAENVRHMYTAALHQYSRARENRKRLKSPLLVFSKALAAKTPQINTNTHIVSSGVSVCFQRDVAETTDNHRRQSRSAVLCVAEVLSLSLSVSLSLSLSLFFSFSLSLPLSLSLSLSVLGVMRALDLEYTGFLMSLVEDRQVDTNKHKNLSVGMCVCVRVIVL